MSEQDINVLALVKGEERYIFLFDDASRAETLRVLGRYASDPELSMTWHDAAVLSQKVRSEAKDTQASEEALPSEASPRFTMPAPSDNTGLDEAA